MTCIYLRAIFLYFLNELRDNVRYFGGQMKDQSGYRTVRTYRVVLARCPGIAMLPIGIYSSHLTYLIKPAHEIRKFCTQIR